MALDYQIASRIRANVSAMEKQVVPDDNDEETAAWIEWALNKAEYSGAAEPRFRNDMSHRFGHHDTTIPAQAPVNSVRRPPGRRTIIDHVQPNEN